MPERVDYVGPRKVLRLVQELHVLGYQRLRIAPGMSASGMDWRCAITDRANTLRVHGARMRDWDLCAHYTTGQKRKYFGWTDVAHARPIELAQRFLERYPEIAESGRGEDWQYAGWYLWMMHLTYPRAFPYAYADWPIPTHQIPTSGDRDVFVPLPPPGEAEEIEVD